MGTINVSLPSDGETADAADYNTPITTIVDEINGGLDNNNIASGAAIDADKLAGGVSGMFGAWQDYTPSITAGGGSPTVGNGTITGKYIQIGKTVFFYVELEWGSTTSFGSGTVSISLPVEAASFIGTAGIAHIGSAHLEDSGTVNYSDWKPSVNGQSSLTTFAIYSPSASGSNSSVNASSPFTWTTNDSLQVTGFYPVD